MNGRSNQWFLLGSPPLLDPVVSDHRVPIDPSGTTGGKLVRQRHASRPVGEGIDCFMRDQWCSFRSCRSCPAHATSKASIPHHLSLICRICADQMASVEGGLAILGSPIHPWPKPAAFELFLGPSKNSGKAARVAGPRFGCWRRCLFRCPRGPKKVQVDSSAAQVRSKRNQGNHVSSASRCFASSAACGRSWVSAEAAIYLSIYLYMTGNQQAQQRDTKRISDSRTIPLAADSNLHLMADHANASTSGT